jgi:hypothetical protein
MTAPNFVVLDASLPDVARLVTAMVQACDAGGRQNAFWSSWASPSRLARAPHYLYAMLLRPEYLSQELDRPLPTKDGGILRTIRDACNYMTGVGKQRELRTHWQRACKLILAKEDVLTVSRALELALFMDAKLDVSKL